MPRYPLSLPQQLKQQAEFIARQQGVSLNQFILWAVAEKVGSLAKGFTDANFPGITYRPGPDGQPIPTLQGTSLRVRTLVVCHHDWGMDPAEIAHDYDLPEVRVREALAFYAAHRSEIESSLTADRQLEEAHG